MSTSNWYKDRMRAFEALARERREAEAQAERDLAARTRFVGIYGKREVTGTFAEVGDILLEKGYQMAKAEANSKGQLVIPHKSGKEPALLTKVVLDG